MRAPEQFGTNHKASEKERNPHPELVRDLVRHIQSVRKQAEFDVTDRIQVTFFANEEMAAAISAHNKYLAT